MGTTKRRANAPRRNPALPPNTGKRWTAEETRALCAAYDKGRSVEQLMKAHKRLRGAIVGRLRIGGRLPWPGA